jgi:hypothetical protein
MNSDIDDYLFYENGSNQLNNQELSNSKAKVIIGLIKTGDLEGLTIYEGISWKNAVSTLHKYNEKESASKERKILRTPDARRLKNEILSIFSEEADSIYAKNKILNLTPTLSKEIILERLEYCVKGREIFLELKNKNQLLKYKQIFQGLSPDKLILNRIKDKEVSDIIGYFIYRKRILESGYNIIKNSTDLETINSFFKEFNIESIKKIIEEINNAQESEIKDAEAIISDSEIMINERFREGTLDKDKALGIIENQLIEILTDLNMNFEEESELRKAFFERVSVPFEFDRSLIRKLIANWKNRKEEEIKKKIEKIERFLEKNWDTNEKLVQKVVLLDILVSIGSLIEKYSLCVPTVGRSGIGFIKGQNKFLIKDSLENKKSSVQPISYALGKTPLILSEEFSNIALLTGANSGGKTTLLTTLAAIEILTLLGLPVPCEKAYGAIMPVYLFRRRMTKKIGSLEQALGTLIPVFADRYRKLILIDEFEALTEPGAAGRILAAIINKSALSSNLVLLVTHLASETLPHVKLPIRVDGIEAEGIDDKGFLVVDRQPKFNHVGSSTPKFIVEKLSKNAKNQKTKTFYQEILSSIIGDSKQPVQTPINIPWISKIESDSRNKETS